MQKDNCLVFKIEEFENDIKSKIDNTIYILYDKNEHKYIIRGKRRDLLIIKSNSYSFNCDYIHDLKLFISYIICSKNKYSFTLLNYNNLSKDSDDITFDFLNKYDKETNEISGYDNQEYNKKKILNYLRIIKNIYNYY
jgi:hypothetical protein